MVQRWLLRASLLHSSLIPPLAQTASRHFPQIVFRAHHTHLLDCFATLRLFSYRHLPSTQATSKQAPARVFWNTLFLFEKEGSVNERKATIHWNIYTPVVQYTPFLPVGNLSTWLAGSLFRSLDLKSTKSAEGPLARESPDCAINCAIVANNNSPVALSHTTIHHSSL